MAQFENVEVPFVRIGNRQALTGLQLEQEPWLKDFVKQFPQCFELDCRMDVLIYYPDGDAPRGLMLNMRGSA